MYNQAKQENIPTPARLADNLIGSLGGLTALEGAELRRQVVMLINHSYALGYAAGAGVGLVARMQSRIAHASRRTWRRIKLALSNNRERLTKIFRDHGPRSRQMLAPPFIIPYPIRGAMITDAVPIRRFRGNRPAALLAPAADLRPRNQFAQPRAGSPGQGRPKAHEGAPPQFRDARDVGRDREIPQLPYAPYMLAFRRER
jgi:hypothetical protein